MTASPPFAALTDAARRRPPALTALRDPTVFAPADDDARPSQADLLRRIDEALDFAQSYLSAHPEAGNQGVGIPAATEVPRPHGSYPEVLEALAAELSPLDPDVQSNRGNWFHNLWHAANGTS